MANWQRGPMFWDHPEKRKETMFFLSHKYVQMQRQLNSLIAIRDCALEYLQDFETMEDDELRSTIKWIQHTLKESKYD